MYSLIRFIAIALPWLFFLVGVEVLMDPHEAGHFVFMPGHLFYLLLPVYAGIVVMVLRRTKDDDE